jgi:hypothetical protein
VLGAVVPVVRLNPHHSSCCLCHTRHRPLGQANHHLYRNQPSGTESTQEFFKQLLVTEIS